MDSKPPREQHVSDKGPAGKQSLEKRVFDSLDAMMAAYADEAVRVARTDYGLRLEYADHPVQQVEEILTVIEGGGASPLAATTDVEYVTRLWGAYLGELLRSRYNGAWEMSVYPGGSLAVPALELKGSRGLKSSRIYPLMKVHRRLTLGVAENVETFYKLVIERLGEPARAH